MAIEDVAEEELSHVVLACTALEALAEVDTARIMRAEDEAGEAQEEGVNNTEAETKEAATMLVTATCNISKARPRMRRQHKPTSILPS